MKEREGKHIERREKIRKDRIGWISRRKKERLG